VAMRATRIATLRSRPILFVIQSRRGEESRIFFFPSLCEGEDQSESPNSARASRTIQDSASDKLIADAWLTQREYGKSRARCGRASDPHNGVPLFSAAQLRYPR
jgi:hypothetical protein